MVVIQRLILCPLIDVGLSVGDPDQSRIPIRGDSPSFDGSRKLAILDSNCGWIEARIQGSRGPAQILWISKHRIVAENP